MELTVTEYQTTPPPQLVSPNSLAARRLRHHSIAINPLSSNKDIACEEKLSMLQLPSHSDTTTSDISKGRSKSVSTTSHSDADKRGTKAKLCMQRSLSLQEFDEIALAAELGEVSSTHPAIPNYKTVKYTPPMVRRSSSIQHCQVFTADDFEFGEILGMGFFGKAVKATHISTGEVMVVKELVNCDEDAKKTFQKESALLRGLSHSKLLKYIGFLYTKAKDLHIITEYVSGGTLENRLMDPKPLSYIYKLSLTIDIASAMEYLHSQKIIHRDLNSPNCFLRQDGSVVVADFGLSKLIIDSSSSLQKSSSSPTPHKFKRKKYTVVGNPYWMAPEMVRGECYDESIDIFSFGIIICEVIGQVKADPDYLPRLGNFALDEKTFIEKFCQSCPEPFYRHAFQCCHMNPDERPPFQKSFKILLQLYKSQIVADRKALKSTSKP